MRQALAELHRGVFGTQKRMSDYHFSRAATWPELHAVHARFFQDYNHQRHFAHEHRPKAGRAQPGCSASCRAAGAIRRTSTGSSARGRDGGSKPPSCSTATGASTGSGDSLARRGVGVGARQRPDGRVRRRHPGAVPGGLRPGQSCHRCGHGAAAVRDALPLAPALPARARRGCMAAGLAPAALSGAATSATGRDGAGGAVPVGGGPTGPGRRTAMPRVTTADTGVPVVPGADSAGDAGMHPARGGNHRSAPAPASDVLGRPRAPAPCLTDKRMLGSRATTIRTMTGVGHRRQALLLAAATAPRRKEDRAMAHPHNPLLSARPPIETRTTARLV